MGDDYIDHVLSSFMSAKDKRAFAREFLLGVSSMKEVDDQLDMFTDYANSDLSDIKTVSAVSKLRSATNLLKGKVFEELCYWVLRIHPDYIGKYKEVYMIEDVPREILIELQIGRADKGIDFIVVDNNGVKRGVQAKYVNQTNKINAAFKKQDLGGFYGLLLHCGINGILMITHHRVQWNALYNSHIESIYGEFWDNLSPEFFKMMNTCIIRKNEEEERGGNRVFINVQQLSRERDELIRERDELMRECSELARSRAEIICERDELVRESNIIAQERDQLSKDRAELLARHNNDQKKIEFLTKDRDETQSVLEGYIMKYERTKDELVKCQMLLEKRPHFLNIKGDCNEISVHLKVQPHVRIYTYHTDLNDVESLFYKDITKDAINVFAPDSSTLFVFDAIKIIHRTVNIDSIDPVSNPENPLEPPETPV